MTPATHFVNDTAEFKVFPTKLGQVAVRPGYAAVVTLSYVSLDLLEPGVASPRHLGEIASADAQNQVVTAIHEIAEERQQRAVEAVSTGAVDARV